MFKRLVYIAQNKARFFSVYNAIKTIFSLAYLKILRYNSSSWVFKRLKTGFDFSKRTVPSETLYTSSAAQRL